MLSRPKHSTNEVVAPKEEEEEEKIEQITPDDVQYMLPSAYSYCLLTSCLVTLATTHFKIICLPVT